MSIRSEPQHSSIFPISSCFLPHPPSTFVSSQPLSIPFFSSFPPGSSVCVKVHVRSVPTRFSPPTLVPLPCPELPKGDKCIEHPWPLCGRGQWAGDPAQPCRLLFLSLCVGKRTKKPRPLHGVSVNTFVDKLKATLPLPCPFCRLCGRSETCSRCWRAKRVGETLWREGKSFLLPQSFGKASSPAALPVPGGFCAGETRLRLLGRNRCLPQKPCVSPITLCQQLAKSCWPGGAGEGAGGVPAAPLLCWRA